MTDLRKQAIENVAKEVGLSEVGITVLMPSPFIRGTSEDDYTVALRAAVDREERLLEIAFIIEKYAACGDGHIALREIDELLGTRRDTVIDLLEQGGKR